MLRTTFLLSVLFLAGCEQIPEYRRPSAGMHPPKDPTVTWCEVRAGKRECWQVPRSEVQRAIDVLGGTP